MAEALAIFLDDCHHFLQFTALIFRSFNFSAQRYIEKEFKMWMYTSVTENCERRRISGQRPTQYSLLTALLVTYSLEDLYRISPEPCWLFVEVGESSHVESVCNLPGCAAP